MLLLFWSCSSDLKEDNQIIADLRQKNKQLLEEIEQGDIFVENFSYEYNKVLSKLDSINSTKDSLLHLSTIGRLYSDSELSELQKKLEQGQLVIRDLKKRLESNENQNATIRFLKAEINRTEEKVKSLEEERTKLIAQNESIKLALNTTTDSLITAKAKVRIANNKLNETLTSLKVVTQQTEEEIQQTKLQSRLERAQVFFDKAMNGYSELDKYIKVSKNGKVTVNIKGTRKKFALEDAKKIALQIFKDLSEASRLGHPEAENQIKILLNSPKYQPVAPR